MTTAICDTRLPAAWISCSMAAAALAAILAICLPRMEVLAARPAYKAPASVFSRPVAQSAPSARVSRRARHHDTAKPAALASVAAASHPAGPDAVKQSVMRAVKAAQRTMKADPRLLLAIASKESSFNPTARNRHSSAQGLLQFTTVTWLTVIRDFGARHGLGRYANAIETDQQGRLTVRSPRLRREILALRNDPKLQAIMTVERLEQSRGALEQRLGRPATAADFYFLHLLGPSGAARFLTELALHPTASSVTTVGGVARPNAGLFIKDGRVLTVAEAYEDVQSQLSEQASRYAGQFEPKVTAVANR